jgi:hypothetical protein
MACSPAGRARLRCTYQRRRRNSGTARRPTPPAGPKAARTTTSLLPLDWAGAIDTVVAAQPLVLAPFQKVAPAFLNSGYEAFRYLILSRPAPGMVSAAVVEVLVRNKQAYPAGARQRLLAKLYRHYRFGGEAELDGFTGAVFFYTPDYRYRAGRYYEAGRLLASRVRLLKEEAPAATGRLKTLATNGCTIYRIVSHDPPYNETICTSTPDLGDSDPGQPVFFDPGYGGPVDAPADPGTGPVGSGGNATNGTVSISLGTLRPCASQVAINVQSMANNSILNGGPVAQLIAAITANPNIKVTINEEPNLKTDGRIDRATTTPGSTPGSYTITFNSDFLSGPDAATDLAIASDLIHELLHVYMLDWAVNHNSDPNVDFNSLMLLYTMQQQQDKNLSQHEIMTNLVGYMAQALQAYFLETFISSGRFSPMDLAYCEYIVWGGLQGTDEYKNRARADPDWAVKVEVYTKGERHPALRGATAGTIVINPRGNQVCP